MPEVEVAGEMVATVVGAAVKTDEGEDLARFRRPTDLTCPNPLVRCPFQRGSKS